MQGELKNLHSVDNSKLINIVVPTYNGGAKLEVIINSLLSQTCNNYHITIVSDGPSQEVQDQLRKYNENNNISYYELSERYNDWGHTPREFGIYTSECRFTLMTGYDNYYVPEFVENFERVINENDNVGFVYCDFITHHDRGSGKYHNFVESRIEASWIDVGCFAAETKLIKEVGFKSREFAADWHLVSSLQPLLLSNNKTTVKINKILYVHN
jgi:glycosyltransferase involved in cell wall biosynthesis